MWFYRLAINLNDSLLKVPSCLTRQSVIMSSSFKLFHFEKRKSMLNVIIMSLVTVLTTQMIDFFQSLCERYNQNQH